MLIGIIERFINNKLYSKFQNRNGRIYQNKEVVACVGSEPKRTQYHRCEIQDRYIAMAQQRNRTREDPTKRRSDSNRRGIIMSQRFRKLQLLISQRPRCILALSVRGPAQTYNYTKETGCSQEPLEIVHTYPLFCIRGVNVWM